MKTAKIKPSIAVNNATRFCWFFFYFSQVFPGCCWLPSPVRAGVPQLFYDPHCPREPSRGTKLLIPPARSHYLPRTPAALVPVQGPRHSFVVPVAPAAAWLAQFWYAGQHNVCQPRYSLRSWYAADVWNPRAGVRELVCSIQPQCRDLAPVVTQALN